MEKNFEPVLSEEQMAAYLDGMLSTEESNMVEEIISSNPDMEEIQDTIDSIDSLYIYEYDYEIPIECMADEFSLPEVDNYYTQDEYDEMEQQDQTEFQEDNFDEFQEDRYDFYLNFDDDTDLII